MTTVDSALARFRVEPHAKRADNPFKLVSSVSDPAPRHQIQTAWDTSALPNDAVEMWSASQQARLFEDIEYGQWGLALLDPMASFTRTAQERRARPADIRQDDIVLGTFLGDQELLVLAPSEAGFRRVMVALPLDPRADWFGVAGDLGAFLENYFAAGGDKFWEPARRT